MDFFRLFLTVGRCQEQAGEISKKNYNYPKFDKAQTYARYRPRISFDLLIYGPREKLLVYRIIKKKRVN